MFLFQHHRWPLWLCPTELAFALCTFLRMLTQLTKSDCIARPRWIFIAWPQHRHRSRESFTIDKHCLQANCRAQSTHPSLLTDTNSLAQQETLVEHTHTLTLTSRHHEVAHNSHYFITNCLAGRIEPIGTGTVWRRPTTNIASFINDCPLPEHSLPRRTARLWHLSGRPGVHAPRRPECGPVCKRLRNVLLVQGE